MLLCQHARRHVIRIHPGLHVHVPLRDNLTLIELLVDEVHRGPGEPRTGRHDSLVHVVTVHAFPAERGEQRGMYVEHLVFVRAAQLRRNESQVPRE